MTGYALQNDVCGCMNMLLQICLYKYTVYTSTCQMIPCNNIMVCILVRRYQQGQVAHLNR